MNTLKNAFASMFHVENESKLIRSDCIRRSGCKEDTIAKKTFNYLDNLVEKCKSSIGSELCPENPYVNKEQSIRDTFTYNRQASCFTNRSNDSGIVLSPTGISASISLDSFDLSLERRPDYHNWESPRRALDVSCKVSNASLESAFTGIGHIKAEPLKNDEDDVIGSYRKRLLANNSRDSFLEMGSLQSNSENIPDVEIMRQKRSSIHIHDRSDSGIFDKSASVKLSLQLFSNVQLLRVIVRKAKHLSMRSGNIYCKVALFREGGDHKTETLKTFRVADQEAINQEVLFGDNDLNDGYNWNLRVRVYYKRSMFSRRKCVGETTIALDRFDLFMNTTCWCLLRPKAKGEKEPVIRDDDIQVLSRDRSIRAYAKASIDASYLFNTTPPTPQPDNRCTRR